MNIRTVLLFAALLLPAGLLFSQEAGVQFEQGNAAYRSGNYKEAARLYESVAKNGYDVPEVYYNLGNACFKLNDIPGAILAFERARRLAPNDDDILYNLRLANLRVVDKIEPIPRFFLLRWWDSFAQMFSSDGWAEAGVVAIWLLVVCGAFFILLRSVVVQRLLLAGALASFVMAATAFVTMGQQKRAEQAENGAIVFSQTVSVKSSPDNQSTDLFVLHEGVKVDLLDSVGEWRKIRLADGKVGWVVLSAVQPI